MAAKKAARASSNTAKRNWGDRRPLSIIVDAKTSEFLAKRARAEGTSKSALVAQALQAHFSLKSDQVARRPHNRG